MIVGCLFFELQGSTIEMILSGLFDGIYDFLVEIVTITGRDFDFLDRCHRFPATGSTLLDTLLDLDVQVGVFLLQPPIGLSLTLVMFAESYFHIKHRLVRLAVERRLVSPFRHRSSVCHGHCLPPV